MKKIIYFSNLKWLLLSFLIAILDICTKCLVVYNCAFGEPVVISSFINCYYIHNFGVAFGLFSDFGFEKGKVLLFVIILIIFILSVMLCFIDGNNIRCYFHKISYVMIIGGALGNMFDRMFYGVVIDFIDFHIGNYHWPTFNFADINIFIGFVLILCIHK